MEKKNKKTAVRIVVIVLIALIAVILTLAIVCVSIFVNYYNKFKDPEAPDIIVNTGTYVADVDNPEGIITGTGVPDDLLPEEDEVHGGNTVETQGAVTEGPSNNTSTNKPSGGGSYRPPAYNHLTTNYEGKIPIYKVDQKSPDIVNIIVVGGFVLRTCGLCYGRFVQQKNERCEDNFASA